jgi:hypothetical protein
VRADRLLRHGQPKTDPLVGADDPGGWSQYKVWLRMCWQGRVADVLVELDGWQERLGASPAGEARTAEERRGPRRLVAEARSYLRNS